MRYLAWCLRGAAAREVSVQYRLHWRTRQRRFKCAFRHSRAPLIACAAVHSTAAQEAIDDGLFWAMLAHTILLRTQVALPVSSTPARPDGRSHYVGGAEPCRPEQAVGADAAVVCVGWVSRLSGLVVCATGAAADLCDASIRFAFRSI